MTEILDTPANMKTTHTGATKVSAQHDLLLQAWECAFLGGSIVYLSGPITTGPRFVEWYRSVGHDLINEPRLYRTSLNEKVIEPNSRDVREAATRLRASLHEPVLEPASLFVAEWSQRDYLALWARVIERFAARLIVMPGWELSTGCAAELERAFIYGLPVTTLDGRVITLDFAEAQLRDAAESLQRDNVPVSDLLRVAQTLRSLGDKERDGISRVLPRQIGLRKDASLDRLADVINVAQFVSFSPAKLTLKQEYSRVLGLEPNHKFKTVRHALGSLLERSSERSINLRSYTPESPQSREFIYGIRSIDEAVAAAERLGTEGLFVIANETIDVHDGGVSGVVMNNVIEFSPDDTPRGVEKPGVASLPRLWGIGMLSTVYGYLPDINVPLNSRLEFSVHPKPRGWKNTHTIGWEFASSITSDLKAKLNWPNHFSRMIGDKVYGLLIAHLAGLPVPSTTVINRRVAPFTFGRPTDSREVWIRTSPHEQAPGRFTTVKGWLDPFKLLQTEDASNSEIASVLSQAAVPAVYAGAAILAADGKLVIEGKSGEGDTFMKGESPPEALPDNVRLQVEQIYERASAILGPVRFEWVYDGNTTWIVQLHRGITQSTFAALVPGDATHWISFEIERGLEQLRELVSSMEPGAGLVLQGEVGLTSHIADVIRRAGIPARIRATARNS